MGLAELGVNAHGKGGDAGEGLGHLRGVEEEEDIAGGDEHARANAGRKGSHHEIEMIEKGHQLAIGADEGQGGENFAKGRVERQALRCAAGVDQEDTKGVEGFFVANLFLVGGDGAKHAEGRTAGACVESRRIGNDDGLLARWEKCAQRSRTRGAQADLMAITSGLVFVGGGENDVIPGKPGLMADEGAFVCFSGAGKQGVKRGSGWERLLGHRGVLRI